MTGSLRTEKSIPDLVLFTSPIAEDLEALPAAERDEFNHRTGRLDAHLLVEQLVPESDPVRVPAGATVIDARDPCPEDRGEAHRARLACRVQVAFREIEGLEPGRGSPDRHDFGVGRRVESADDFVVRSGDDLPPADDDRPERPAVIFPHPGGRLRRGHLHKIEEKNSFWGSSHPGHFIPIVSLGQIYRRGPEVSRFV